MQHRHGEPGGTQVIDHAAFIAAARLDTSALDPDRGQALGELTPAGRRVRDRERLGRAGDCNVELVLGGIDPGRQRDIMRHLPRPCLVKRNQGSANHAGPMKRPARSCYTAALRLRMGAIRRRPASPRVATRGDTFLSEQDDNTPFRYYKDGIVVRAILAACV